MIGRSFLKSDCFLRNSHETLISNPSFHPTRGNADETTHMLKAPSEWYHQGLY